MALELQILLAAAAYGAVQAALTGRFARAAQIHRNFSETFYLFAVCVLGLAAVDGFGGWSDTGAVLYAAGRTAYVGFSFPALLKLRKYPWALSIAGIVGVAAELARAGAEALG